MQHKNTTIQRKNMLSLNILEYFIENIVYSTEIVYLNYKYAHLPIVYIVRLKCIKYKRWHIRYVLLILTLTVPTQTKLENKSNNDVVMFTKNKNIKIYIYNERYFKYYAKWIEKANIHNGMLVYFILFTRNSLGIPLRCTFVGYIKSENTCANTDETFFFFFLPGGAERNPSTSCPNYWKLIKNNCWPLRYNSGGH